MNDSFTHDEMYPRKAFLPVSFVRGALSCEPPHQTNNFPCIAAPSHFIIRPQLLWHNQQSYLFPPQTTAGSMYSGHSRRGRYPDCNRSSYIRTTIKSYVNLSSTRSCSCPSCLTLPVRRSRSATRSGRGGTSSGDTYLVGESTL